MEFVTYKIAKELKEKGFRKPCIAHYFYLYENVLKFNIGIGCISGSNVKCMNDENDIYIDAPTISQVLQWLREKWDYHICIGYDGEYSYDVVHIKSCEFCGANDGYDSYEEAALEGIKHILDNLI